MSKRTNARENLNDYIIFITTIREPVDGAPEEEFYFEVEIDTEYVKSLLDISSTLMPPDNSVQIIRSIMGRFVIL